MMILNAKGGEEVMNDDSIGGDTKMSREQRGKKGGETTKRRHGSGFFSEIGSEGGRTAQERGTAHDLTDEERSRGGQS